MLNVRLACLACLLLVPGLVRASDETAPLEVKRSPKNVISVAPVSFLLGSVGLEYERALADPVSLTVSADYRWLSNPTLGGSAPTPTSLTGVNVGAHIFMLGKAPSGLWLGPELGAIFSSQYQDGERSFGSVPRFAMQLGYTGIIGDVFSVSVGAGVQFLSVIPLPSLRMSFGFAF